MTSKCPRVQKRMECFECGYLASEAQYFIVHTGPEGKTTYGLDPIYGHSIPDPGHRGTGRKRA